MVEGYSRVKKLGEGAFASVHLVRDERTGEHLVLKKIACRNINGANKALREVKLLRSCSHSGIIGYRDFSLVSGSDDDIVICLIMEFCDAGDVWDRVASACENNWSLPPPLTTGWMLQIVDALRYLHSRDILHRDIKLENILISGPDQDSVAKLGDFGLAKAFDGAAIDGTAAARTKTKCGTPDYMAPEVLQGKSYSVPAEVFSLGVVFYALASVQLPTMLALDVATGKQLNWPMATQPERELQSLVEHMVKLYEEDRPLLDQVATCAADLPSARLLEGWASQAARAAANTQYPSTGVLTVNGSPVQPRRKPPALPGRGATPSTKGWSSSEDHVPVAAAGKARTFATRDTQPLAAHHRLVPEKALSLPPPDVHIISSTNVVLQLRAPVADEDGQGYCVLMQVGGHGGFREVSAVTGTPATGLHVCGLRAGCWYEFKVSTRTHDSSWAPAAASQPVQMCATDTSLVPLWARPGFSRGQSDVRKGSDRSEGSHRASPHSNPDLSGDLEMDKLAADLRACSVQLLEWDRAWEAEYGRRPMEAELSGDVEYQRVLRRIRRLQQLTGLSPTWRSLAPSPTVSPLNARFRPAATGIGQQGGKVSRSSSTCEDADTAATPPSHLHTPHAKSSREALHGIPHSVWPQKTAAHDAPSLPAAFYSADESLPTPSGSGKHARRHKPWSPAPAVPHVGTSFWSAARARVSRQV